MSLHFKLQGAQTSPETWPIMKSPKRWNQAMIRVEGKKFNEQFDQPSLPCAQSLPQRVEKVNPSQPLSSVWEPSPDWLNLLLTGPKTHSESSALILAPLMKARSCHCCIETAHFGFNVTKISWVILLELAINQDRSALACFLSTKRASCSTSHSSHVDFDPASFSMRCVH